MVRIAHRSDSVCPGCGVLGNMKQVLLRCRDCAPDWNSFFSVIGTFQQSLGCWISRFLETLIALIGRFVSDQSISTRVGILPSRSSPRFNNAMAARSLVSSRHLLFLLDDSFRTRPSQWELEFFLFGHRRVWTIAFSLDTSLLRGTYCSFGRFVSV